MDTLQWAYKVGRREEGEEESARMARSSAPARRFRHASLKEGGGRRERAYRSSCRQGIVDRRYPVHRGR